MGRVTCLQASAQTAQHEAVPWHLQADRESEITTLAAVCQVRRQQRVPLSTRTEEDVCGAESSDDEQTDSHSDALTSVAASLTTGENRTIKMLFLDRLAELLCYKKHASYVTCTSLQETPDEVTILVSRNATWEEKDIKLLEDLANYLERTAAGDSVDETSLPDLQEAFSEFYTPRLRHHASELLDLMRKTDEMGFLVARINAFLSTQMSSQDFVNMVDEICYSATFCSMINRLFPADQVKRQVRELGFLRRPKLAYATFRRAAREISGFQRVRIILLAGAKGKHVPPTPSLCPRLSTKKARTRLEAALQKPKWIHAEMGMVLYLMRTDCAARTFSYLGISKKTCFMCGHILQSLALFQARKNHGKIYSQWTLPSSLILPSRYQVLLESAVQNLQDVLHQEYAVTDDQHIDAVKESTISTPVAPPTPLWSPFYRHIPDPRSQARETEWLSRFSSRTMTTSKNQTDSSVPESVDSPLTERRQLQETPSADCTPAGKPSSCAQCHTTIEPLVPCPKCDSSLYCSEGCRAAHWPEHKYSCRLGRPLDEADDFILACRSNELPKDEAVAKAFGILSFTSAVDRLRIFNLYCQLMNRWGVDEEELREAWRQNKLKEFILFRGSQLPCPMLQTELRWLSQQKGFAANAVSGFEEMLDSQIHLVKPEDRKTPYHLWGPREKLEAYVFLCQLRNGYVPDADEDNWISLGFCTARDDHDIRQLADLYRVLTDKCEFEEFWKAMAASDIVGLFNKHGLGHAIARLRNFETLMTAVGTWHQSVWELKRFTRLPSAEPMRAVVVDYGFCNCGTPQERMELRQVYSEFFAQGGDELDLHEACIKGQVATFLESALKKPIPANLVSNYYPLEGCGYMGMVVESAIFCSKSDYERTKEFQEETGEEGVILAHPDEQDEGMHEGLLKRAEFLGRSLTRRTDFRGMDLVFGM